MDEIGAKYEETEDIGTIIHIVIENEYVGNIVISDEIKEDTKIGIQALKKLPKINKITMLTGDLKCTAEAIRKKHLHRRNIFRIIA